MAINFYFRYAISRWLSIIHSLFVWLVSRLLGTCAHSQPVSKFKISTLQTDGRLILQSQLRIVLIAVSIRIPISYHAHYGACIAFTENAVHLSFPPFTMPMSQKLSLFLYRTHFSWFRIICSQFVEFLEPITSIRETFRFWFRSQPLQNNRRNFNKIKIQKTETISNK